MEQWQNARTRLEFGAESQSLVESMMLYKTIWFEKRIFTEDTSEKIKMAEAVAAKKSRSFKMGAFTKKQNNLKKVLSDDASPLGMAQEAYDALGEAYKDLEKAHEAYFLVADEADLENEGDYLLIPSNSLTETQISFHKFKRESANVLPSRPKAQFQISAETAPYQEFQMKSFVHKRPD